MDRVHLYHIPLFGDVWTQGVSSDLFPGWTLFQHSIPGKNTPDRRKWHHQSFRQQVLMHYLGTAFGSHTYRQNGCHHFLRHRPGWVWGRELLVGRDFWRQLSSLHFHRFTIVLWAYPRCLTTSRILFPSRTIWMACIRAFPLFSLVVYDIWFIP